MRTAYPEQTRFDCQTVSQIDLNLNCRDEIVPILAGLQHIYNQPQLRSQILDLVAQDVNCDSRDDCGREGIGYWELIVLAAVRLGCNLDYDKLQDLAEQHRALRHIMGIGDWQRGDDFSARRIGDNICLLKPQTIEKISHCIVDEAYRLVPDAVKKQRADSFVAETNIHHPTESSLIVDGTRKIIELCVPFHESFDIAGWRQHEHLLKNIKKISRQIARISSRKGKNYNTRLATKYRKLLKAANKILSRASSTCKSLLNDFELGDREIVRVADIKVFIERTEQVCGTARRRVLEGKKVPNEEKLFSIFEPHTQLYRRGKAGQPNQYGRLVLVYEDACGFITHHHVMARDVQDRDVAVSQTRIVQDRLQGRIEELSFDRGFHSPENQDELAKIVDHVCLPKPGANQSVEQLESASDRFHRAKQRHSGIESAIGALQSGNGLERCRDKNEQGFERYIALGVLGRNIQTLGKLQISRINRDLGAASSKRKAA
jgi:IS5 family transposase